MARRIQTIDKVSQDSLFDRKRRRVRHSRHFREQMFTFAEKYIPVPVAARKLRRFSGDRPGALKSRGFNAQNAQGRDRLSHAPVHCEYSRISAQGMPFPARSSPVMRPTLQRAHMAWPNMQALMFPPGQSESSALHTAIIRITGLIEKHCHYLVIADKPRSAPIALARRLAP